MLAWGSRWQTPPHLQALNRELVRIERREITRLIVTMPPRHGKSVLTSEVFPPWYLGHHPDHRVMLASYEASFAASWGRKGRALLRRFGPTYFDLAVSAESSASNEWGIAGHRGGMSTAGVGGALTGKGADVLIIDDSVKNSEEANSPVMRQKVWDWYTSTAYTRLEPDGAIIVMHTRWHADDLIGRILKTSDENGEEWTVVNFPAYAVEHDAIGRSPGDPLWPERFSRERLEQIRTIDVASDYVWDALYQQNPQSKQGKIFDPAWFRYFGRQGDYYQLLNNSGELIKNIHPRECNRFCIIDCAGTSEDEAKERKGKPPSDSVISTFEYHYPTGTIIWVDCVLGRWGFPELLRNIREQFQKHNPAWIGIEDEKTGHAALQTLTMLPVRPISHDGKDKLARSSRAQNQMSQGKIYLDKHATWRKSAERQLTEWTGLQDERIDIGDTLFYAALHAGYNAGGALVIDGFSLGGIGSVRV